ncbi:MAG TPA: phytanoyl-CoA dioxygenase [Lachnospiraceae bacterium]|nr:phytanoyl-CoA dioxygenase [Lachnospiraceae bacterium]
MNKQFEELKRITEIILTKVEEYGELKQACDELFQFFSELSGLTMDKEETREDYYLPGGKAIGTVWAGMCVKEFMRTKKFLTGIYKAILHAQKRFHGQPLHILYAGSGPFGTLLVPLTTKFTPEEIQITFLDINPKSLESLRTIINELQLDTYVKEIILCDASCYRADRQTPIHMVVTETMQRALYKEPQVSITANLAPQMVEGGILIPQNIKIDAVLLDSKRDIERMTGVKEAEQDFYYYLDTIMDLNQSSINAYDRDRRTFLEYEVCLPDHIEDRYDSLSLLTDIQVFEEVMLTYMQCSLNMPYYLFKGEKMRKESIGGRKIGLQYVVGEEPAFQYRWIT